MGLSIGDVSIYKRERSGYKDVKRGSSWYCQLRNPLTGKFSGGKSYSIASLAKQLGFSTPAKINKTDAKNIVQEAISRGLLKYETEEVTESSMSPLVPFVEKICDYDRSPWVQYENKRRKTRLSRKYIGNMARAFRLYAKPNIETKKTIASFSKADAKVLQDKMAEKGASPDNINMAIKAMRTAFNFAIQADIIDYNPLDYIKPYVPKRAEKKVLSRVEANQVIDIMETFAQETPARQCDRQDCCLVIR